MNHLTRDQLILLHYGEAVAPESREHLLACAECRAESEVLRRVFDLVDTSDTPELSPDWEGHVWNRLRWKLERRRSRPMWYAAAVAAMLVVAFLTGRGWQKLSPQPVESGMPVASTSPRPNNTVALASTAEGRERVLLVVLSDHFSRSERVLTEVKNATDQAPAVVIGDRKGLEDLVHKNRLYHEAALATGQSSLAAVLEDIEPLLLELARAPQEPTAQDIEMLQKRIEKKGLVFKLRVAGEQIKQQQSL